MNNFYTATDHFVVLPALLLTLFGSAVLLFDFFGFKGREQRRWLVFLSLVGLVFTGSALWRQHDFLVTNHVQQIVAFRSTLVIDAFALFFNWLFLIASAVVILMSYRFLQTAGEPLGEYIGLVLLAQSGMFFLVTGADLITLFVGLELMAICFYVLVGFLRYDKRSNEAAIKYLILGALSTGFLLYGFSLLYGLSGSTNIQSIATALNERGGGDPIVLLALVTIAVGLFFKVSAAPFHMWAPDAYEGAPTPVTAYLSVASKAASFGLLMRLFLGPLMAARPVWEPLMIAVALASLTVGNLAAIGQSNLKRLLAYSSISHAGYMLLGLIAGNKTGVTGVIVYLMVYTFMTLGAFLVIAAMRRAGVMGEDMDDFSGLMKRHPSYAIWMLVFLISLAGIPPTAGFLGKYYIFLALLETGHYTLAVVAALYVGVSLFYYFRIVKAMFFSEGEEGVPLTQSFGTRFAMAATGVATLAIGVYPEPFLRFANVFVQRAQ